MLKNKKKLFGLFILLSIWGISILQPVRLGQAQSPTASLTLVPLDVIMPEFNVQPLPLQPASLVFITFKLYPAPNLGCPSASKTLANDISVKAAFVPLDALEVVQIDAKSTIVGGVINWNEPFINEEVLSLVYQARVNPDLQTNDVHINFELTYIDCNGVAEKMLRSFPMSTTVESSSPSLLSPLDGDGQNASPEVPPAPDIAPVPQPQPTPVLGIEWSVLLPLLKWMGIALLFGLLLFFLWKFFTRPKAPSIRKEPLPVTSETLDSVPGWFKELKNHNNDFSSDLKSPKIELQETILIGLGPVGRNVLAKISSKLNAQFGDAWRAKIRMIQVDADLRKSPQQHDWQVPSGLRQEEWVLLQPELMEIQSRIQKSPKDWEYLKWYDKTSPTYPRSQSRMALFFDLRDGPPSRFWHAVETAYYDLDKPLVRVIGSTFDSVGSGILADVAFLVKQGITGRNADVEMWLLGPAHDEWSEMPNPGRLSKSEQSIRTLATFRELERFQRNVRVNFQYVPLSSNYTQLNQSYEYAVVPTVFFFDPLAKNQRHDDTIREMADTLSSVLYERTARLLSKHLSDTRAKAAGKSVMCGIGHFELRLSSGLLEEAVTWRVVKDVLFEEMIGLFPLEKIQANGEYQELGDFIPTPSLDVFHEQESIKRWVNYSVKTGDTKKLYGNIAARLGQILNGEPAAGIAGIRMRRMSLEKADRWLKLLVNTIKMYPEIQIEKKINKIQDQLSTLRDWLLNEVANMARSKWSEVRANLNSLRISSGMESDIPPNLEWPTYKEYILMSEVQLTKHTDQFPLLKVAQRLGWHVNFDENENEWHVNLVMPPASFSWQEGYRPEPFAIPISASEFLKSLYQIALPFARTGIGRSAAERANAADVSDWKTRVAPLVRFDDLEATRLLGSLAHKYILGVSEELSPRESRELAGKLNAIVKPVDVVDTNDRSVVHFLHVVNWIPFETIDTYKSEQWAMNAVPASYYVWPLEQWAADVEIDSSRRLSVKFLTRFNENEQFMTVFGLGLIYDLFTSDAVDANWLVPFAETEGVVWKTMKPYRNPHLASNLLEMFFAEREFEFKRNGCVSVWTDLINERRGAVKDVTYEFFRDFERNKLKMYFYSDSDNEDVHMENDLGIFLTYLLQLEKQSMRVR